MTARIDEVRLAARRAFEDGADWLTVLAAIAQARREMKRQRTAKARRPLAGCPSEAQYRRHLKAGEKCTQCRAHVQRIEEERRARHPEWWVRGAGRPVRRSA